MKIHTKAVHAGDRKKLGSHVPVTTPIYTASAYSYESMEQLDRIFGQEEDGLLLCALRQLRRRPRSKSW